MSSNQNVKRADIFLLHDRKLEQCRHSEISRKGYDLLAYAMKCLFLKDDGTWTIARGTHGKPYFPRHPEVQFNISHSGDWIALALSPVPIGIDIQVHKGPRSDRLARRIFSDEEWQKYRTSDDPKTYFFQRWALKESFVKLTGEGITRSLKDLPDGPWSMILAVDCTLSCAVCAGETLSIQKHRLEKD